MTTSDSTTTVAQLKELMAQFAHERDWEQFHAPKNLSMAIATEAGELMEHFLWCSPEESRTLMRNEAKFAKVAEELADIVLFALQFSNVAKIDLAKSVTEKLAENAAKYPAAKVRGRSSKYNEY